MSRTVRAAPSAGPYQNLPINEGEQYLVVISHQDKIAGQAWGGQEVKVGQCLS